MTGFKTNVRKGIQVELNQVVTFNSILEIGETKEVVEVTSEAPLVDTTSTQLGAIVNNKSVNELPLNSRDTYQFLQLQPGVQSQLGSSGAHFTAATAPGAVSVNGGRGRSNNFSVNGGDANDLFVNAADRAAFARQHCGISRDYQYVRRGVWAQLGIGGQCGHQVGNERVAWKRL